LTVGLLQRLWKIGNRRFRLQPNYFQAFGNATFLVGRRNTAQTGGQLDLTLDIAFFVAVQRVYPGVCIVNMLSSSAMALWLACICN